MTSEDAEKFILHWLREPKVRQSGYSSYGYGVYLPNVMRDYLAHEGHDPQTLDHQLPGISHLFYAAAWDLCRRGILRPGIRQLNLQSTADGGSGNGYSVTPFGEQWLTEVRPDDFVPTEPGRFGQMLEPFRERFGPQFYERAQEAVRCYGAHAYLACCTMCGAAAESILLAAATAKDSEASALRAYNSAAGRSRIEKLLVGQARDRIRREFLGFTSLLKYWRDAASHGGAASVADDEAFTSLALTLRFAVFVSENWDELVGPQQQRG